MLFLKSRLRNSETLTTEIYVDDLFLNY